MCGTRTLALVLTPWGTFLLFSLLRLCFPICERPLSITASAMHLFPTDRQSVLGEFSSTEAHSDQAVGRVVEKVPSTLPLSSFFFKIYFYYLYKVMVSF